ncbi:MAG: hypothetical protein ACYTEL_22185 [Planctomycetota bacterium]|jgi:hypothetical protein
MCKKLMFLISFVALLGLVNVAFADEIDWIGTGSFCDPCNWDGGVVPGPDDEAVIDCDDGEGDVVIDCDFTVDRLHGPAFEGDCNQTMTIVSGTGLCNDRWRAAMEGDGIGTVDWTGGTITVVGEMRCNDDAKWRAYFNMSGTAVLDVGYRIRSGDSGGNDNQTHWTIAGDAILVSANYLRVGDDGGGSVNIGGNASVTTGSDLYIVCREMSASMDFSGGETYVGDDLRIGNPGQAAGKAPTTADMTMSGGTVNAKRVRLGWEPYKPDDFSCTVDISGGLLIAREDLQVGEKTTVSFTGGEIRVDNEETFEIDDGGTMDICGGVLKIKGNVASDIAAMVCDGSGRLTGCGAPQGVIIEYDGVYTIVTGTSEYNADQAYCLVPPCGAERIQSVTTNVILEWQAGAKVGSRGRHLVYFGSDCDAVAAAGPGDPENVCVNRADDLDCDVGNLPLWECFCWRVDEFNQDGTTTTGVLCSFCTGCEDIPGDCNRDCLLNFEDYATTVDDFGEQIYWP